MKRVFAIFSILIIMINTMYLCVTNAAAKSLTLEETVIEAALKGEKTVNVEKFKISTADANNITTRLLQTEFELYSIERIDSAYKGKYISNFYLVYNTAAVKNSDLIDTEINKIVMSAKKSDTQIEQAKYVFNYLIINYDYDYSLENHNVYEIIKTGKGVCTAYSMLYKKCLDKLDIPCELVTSDRHCWNEVNIDGHWYNVDVSAAEMAEINDFKYTTFLKSDKYFKYLGNISLVQPYDCTDTKYD